MNVDVEIEPEIISAAGSAPRQNGSQAVPPHEEPAFLPRGRLHPEIEQDPNILNLFEQVLNTMNSSPVPNAAEDFSAHCMVRPGQPNLPAVKRILLATNQFAVKANRHFISGMQGLVQTAVNSAVQINSRNSVPTT